MADSFTQTLRLQQPTVGADAATWGGYLNTDLVLIDNAINGVSTINIAGLASYSLTVANGAVDQARNLVYNFTGTLSANCTVTLPPNVKFGYAVNSTTGGHTVILTTGSGTTLTLPTAAYYTFFTCDGVNVLAPSVGFGYTNITKDLLVSGNLNVNGLTGIGNFTAGSTTVSSLNSTGTVTIGTATHLTNGDGFVPFMNANWSGLINQSVRTDVSPVFADVGITGLGFIKASFLNQSVMSSASPTFNNIWFSYLGNYISAYINQVVTSGSQPNFYNVYFGVLGDYINNYLNQRVRTVDTPTFNNIGLSYLGNSLQGVLNQDVRNVASPTFQNVGLSYLGNSLQGVLNQAVKSTDNPTFNNVFVTALGDFITNRVGQDVRSGASPGFANLTSAGTVDAFSNSTQCFHAPNGGGAAALGWVTGSDISYKTDVHTITGALDKLAAFRGVSFTRKLDGKARLGVIGQEVQEQFPEVVDDIEGKLHVDYSGLIGPLIEAVKELRAEVASLKAQLA